MAKGQIKCLRCDGGLNDDKFMCNECRSIMQGRQGIERTFVPTPTIRVRTNQPQPVSYEDYQLSYVQREQIERISSQLNSTQYGISPTDINRTASLQAAMYGTSTSSTRAPRYSVNHEGNITEAFQENPN